MPLVDYGTSDSEEDDLSTPRAAKRPRLSSTTTGSTSEAKTKTKAPPLPSTFLDLYSSTVRTSTQDDPSLHGGRKRVTPHVEGHWPTHVYLDWHPSQEEAKRLKKVVDEAGESRSVQGDEGHSQNSIQVTSLLHNDLGVPLPLHVSLSRPLVLRTEQRDAFLTTLRRAFNETRVTEFAAVPAELMWHPNESSTRWFLVLQLQRPDGDELAQLLKASNATAGAFDQPLLYVDEGRLTNAASETDAAARKASDSNRGSSDVSEDPVKRSDRTPAAREDNHFHLSLAWALQARPAGKQDLSQPSMAELRRLRVQFGEVKVRIGQEVHSITLLSQRARQKGVGEVG